jgi:hypothetical protein
MELELGKTAAATGGVKTSDQLEPSHEVAFQVDKEEM